MRQGFARLHGARARGYVESMRMKRVALTPRWTVRERKAARWIHERGARASARER
jgi:hypothetical protein